MKFAFCLFNYFPFGGLQRDFLRIAQECIRQNHQVDVYTMSWEGVRDPHLPVTLLPSRAWQNHTRSQQFVKQLQPYLAQGHYDAVVGFNKMPGLDVYYAADTCYQAKIAKQHPWLARLLPRYRHLLAYEKAVFAASAKTTILLIAPTQQTEFMHYYATEANRFHLLPPGIATDRLAPANAAEIRETTRRQLAIADTDFLVLFVGSGFKTKGLDRALLSLAALPPTLKERTQFYIVGQDHTLPFQQQAETLQVAERVHFLGGRHDVPALLLAADLLLHPALHENTGTVLLEALAAGLPVLTTDVCGYAHYILDAQAGCVLSSPFQQTELNETLAAMLLSPQRPFWQQNGLTFAKQTDLYNMPSRAVEIIQHAND